MARRMRKTRRTARKARRAGKVRSAHRRTANRRMVYRRRHGGAALMLSPAGLDYKMEPASLKQGQEFAAGTKEFHGGAAFDLSPAPLDYKLEAPAGASGSGAAMAMEAPAMPSAGSMEAPMKAPMEAPVMPPSGSMQGGAAPLGEALSGSPLLPEGMHASARIAALDKHFAEIKGMSDMAGGRRRRRSVRSVSRKARKGSRKARKASRKARKASRKGRKASRRRSQRGGAGLTPADIGAQPMLLKDYSGAGLNAEWKAAADPDYMKPRSL